MECAKVTTVVRKPKKKQVKDELDRIKQAEKKKRRLEKALATSAAIRSELEKKKLKKKEEQDRLDEEGAAIAEAVALHVLLGEDSDESSKVLLRKDEELTSWGHATNTNIIYNDLSKYSCQNIERVDQYGHFWNHWGNTNLMGPSNYVGGYSHFHPRYFGEECWGSVGVSPGHLAAQAVSSLKIADNNRVDAYVFNRVLRG